MAEQEESPKAQGLSLEEKLKRFDDRHAVAMERLANAPPPAPPSGPQLPEASAWDERRTMLMAIIRLVRQAEGVLIRSREEGVPETVRAGYQQDLMALLIRFWPVMEVAVEDFVDLVDAGRLELNRLDGAEVPAPAGPAMPMASSSGIVMATR